MRVLKAAGELINYLDSNLLTLNSNLLRTNFLRILNSIWQEVLEGFDQVLAKPDDVCILHTTIPEMHHDNVSSGSGFC